MPYDIILPIFTIESGLNMQKIAEFQKVSFERFRNDWIATFGQTDQIEKLYNSIPIPKRATKGSAGYDIVTPAAFILQPGKSIKIPTGIRVRIDEGWVLCIFPRSGLGFKFRLQLDNTVGIIDSDYYYSDNEGHIFIKITNDSRDNKEIDLSELSAFAQGVFMPFGITQDDNTTAVRNGGFGSTSK